MNQEKKTMTHSYKLVIDVKNMTPNNHDLDHIDNGIVQSCRRFQLLLALLKASFVILSHC